MTIREHIVESLDPISTATLETEEEKSKEIELLAYPFTQYIFNMCAILITIAGTILERNKGVCISIGGEEYRPTGDVVSDIRNILLGEDFLNHTELFIKAHMFNSWLLSKENNVEWNDDEDYPKLWYNIEYLSTMWNEYISEKAKEDELE